MAISLEFVDLIIPVALIKERYPGGWDACVDDHRALIGRRVWFDEHLFRDGAISHDEMQQRLEAWTVLGFNAAREHRGKLVCDDLCVVDLSGARGPTMPCDWVRVDRKRRLAWHAGNPPGPTVGRDLAYGRVLAREIDDIAARIQRGIDSQAPPDFADSPLLRDAGEGARRGVSQDR